jgi:protein gp37
MMPTKIEWCDETINPIQDKIKGESGRGYHCTKCSPGCNECYAETINNRFGNHLPFDNRKAEFELMGSELYKPIKWKKHRNIFIQSMGDLFHEDVPDEFIDELMNVMDMARHHTFLMLTKRPERMLEYLEESPANESYTPDERWYGLTVCTQQEADEKIPVFLQVPGKKFLSIEPMLGPIDLRPAHLPSGITAPYWLLKCVDAVILGGETGPKARPMHPDWVRSVRDQCEAAGVPFFFKGWGEYAPWLHCDNISLKENRCWLRADGTQSEHDRADGGNIPMYRVGKKRAGRGLDGRTHDDLPWLKGVL